MPNIKKEKIILGIDPGYARVGVGIVKQEGSKYSCLYYYCIETDKKLEFNQRLFSIAKELNEIIEKYKPTVGIVEKLFFAKNATTAIDVGQARGVILLTLFNHGIDTYELTPLEVKRFITGYGKADKKQVQQVVKMILGLKEIPQPDDAADALALALTWTTMGKLLELSKK
jgi:crossover junction endodeoxyribonuclease RuvC